MSCFSHKSIGRVQAYNPDKYEFFVSACGAPDDRDAGPFDEDVFTVSSTGRCRYYDGRDWSARGPTPVMSVGDVGLVSVVNATKFSIGVNGGAPAEVFSDCGGGLRAIGFYIPSGVTIRIDSVVVGRSLR